MLRARRSSAAGSSCAPARTIEAVVGDDARRGRAARRRQDAGRPTWWCSPAASARASTWRAPRASRSTRASSSTTRWRPRCPASTRRRVRRARRQDLRHRHAGLGAGRRAGRHAHGREPAGALPRLEALHAAEGGGRSTSPRWARIEPELESDEVIQVVETRRGAYRKLIVRDGKLVGAMLVGNTEAAASLVQIFDRGDPLPDDPLEALCPAPRSAPAPRPIAWSATATRSTNAPLRGDRRRRLHRRGARRGDQGRHRLRLLPGRARAADRAPGPAAQARRRRLKPPSPRASMCARVGRQPPHTQADDFRIDLGGSRHISDSHESPPSIAPPYFRLIILLLVSVPLAIQGCSGARPSREPVVPEGAPPAARRAPVAQPAPAARPPPAAPRAPAA